MLQCRTYACTLACVLCICVFCVLFCVPAYVYPRVREYVYSNETVVEATTTLNNGTVVNSTSRNILYYYLVEESELNVRTNNTVSTVMFYTQAILAKFIPCILLVTFSSLLIHSLVVINQNNKV